jgi:hypothetical protein
MRGVKIPYRGSVFNKGGHYTMGVKIPYDTGPFFILLKKSFKIPKPKGEIRIRKSKDGQHNGKKGQKDKQ